MLACLDGVWAEGVLRDRGGDLSAASVKGLTLLATGDARAADRAYARRALEELDRR